MENFERAEIGVARCAGRGRAIVVPPPKKKPALWPVCFSAGCSGGRASRPGPPLCGPPHIRFQVHLEAGANAVRRRLHAVLGAHSNLHSC
jgi:hypothetical protein